jgi:RNA polymerase sigma factor (sigma-70 family)
MPDGDLPELLSELFRAEWARLVATSMRLVGDLQTAEDVVQDVLMSALDRWPLTEVPANPAAWLMTACRNRALNVLRDNGRARDRTRALGPLVIGEVSDDLAEEPSIEDDPLRLMFICCHPALPVDNRVALTLRMVGGLSTEDIARAWHAPTATIAQRIVRAKKLLAQRRVPFVEPAGEELAQRLPAVLDVVYLIFNEGHLASSGDRLTRSSLTIEAQRLSRLLTELLPDQPQTWALRSLIALQRSREDSRVGPDGKLRTLEQQDRDRWDPAQIAEGLDALSRACACTGDRAEAALLIQARLAAYHANRAVLRGHRLGRHRRLLRRPAGARRQTRWSR